MKKETLQDLRLKTEMTQKNVSTQLGVTKEYLSALERGVRNPSDSLKEKMAELYNVSITKIFLACKETKCFKQ